MALSLPQLFEKFPTDEAAEAWFIRQRWPDGHKCPHCESENIQVGAAHKTMPYRCRSCRRRFSAKTGTAMEASNLGYRIWVLAIYRLGTSPKGVPAMQLARDLGITHKSAWHLAHRIRSACGLPTLPFAGPAEIDETHMGGLAKNIHRSRRRAIGLMHKAIIQGARDRATGQVVAEIIWDTAGPTLKGNIRRWIGFGAQVYTDDHRGYIGLKNHESVNHSAGEYVRGDVHTNGIESFWAVLKRGYRGIYHYMSPKHLHRYLAEFVARFNARCLDVEARMAQVANGMVGKRLPWADLVMD